jgi:hypothetical protein
VCVCCCVHMPPYLRPTLPKSSNPPADVPRSDLQAEPATVSCPTAVSMAAEFELRTLSISLRILLDLLLSCAFCYVSKSINLPV